MVEVRLSVGTSRRIGVCGLRCDRWRQLGANNVAGNYDVYAAIQLASRRSAVVRYRIRFTKPLGLHTIRLHARGYEIASHGISALLGKPLIVLVAPDAVGMS